MKNWKTYLSAAALIIVAGLKVKGYITDSVASFLEALFAGCGLAALRHAISKK